MDCMVVRRPTGIRLESQLWLLGVSYGESLEAEGGDAAALKQFQLDFESRLWFTYRSGCDSELDTFALHIKYTIGIGFVATCALH